MPIKPHPCGGNRINIRRIRYGVTIAAQAVRALLVGTDKNEIR